MDLPRVKIEGNGQAFRLKKSLYGLKQSSRAWFGQFARAIRQHGYQETHPDHT